MPGPIQISLEREPSYFAAGRREGGRHYTICAREVSSGSVVAMGSRAVHEVFVNGEPRRVGFLGQLRIAPAHRRFGRFLLQKGFEFLQRTCASDESPFDITTIVASNAVARNTLEKALPGFPVFTAIERVMTMLLPVRRHLLRVRAQTDFSGVAGGNDPRLQFAPVHANPEARVHGVPGASVARWDQRTFKQAVVRGYSPLLRHMRWVSRLPRSGAPVPMAYLTSFRVDDDDARLCSALLDEALAAAKQETDCRWLTLALPLRHPMTSLVLRRYRPHVYESILYAVHSRSTVVPLDGRMAQVEVSLL